MTTNQITGDQQDQDQNLFQQQAQETATSPAGVATAGGTPDQAKMQGTPAQRRPKLSRQERLTKGPSVKAQDAGKTAQSQADRLAQVGSLGARLDAKINAYIDAQQPAEVEAGIDTTSVATAFSGNTQEEIDAATPALEAFLNSGRSEDDLVTLAEQLTEAGITEPGRVFEPGFVNSLYKGLGDVVGDAYKVAAEDVTLGAVDLFESPTEAQEMADILGLETVDELNNMTPDQLEAAIDNLETQQFSEVESLRAELYSAGPARRQQILARLREMGESGESTADVVADEAVAEIEEGQEIQFAGSTYSLKELLSDEGMSAEIRKAVENEEDLEQLMQTEPELAQWIKDKKEFLQDILTSTTEGALVGQRTQAAYEEFKAEVGEDLYAAFLGDQEDFLTTEELDAKKEQLAGDTLYQEAQESDALKSWLGLNPGKVDALREADGLRELLKDGESGIDQWLKDDPELFDKLKDMKASEIKDGMRATTMLQQSDDVYGGILDDMARVGEGDFLTDPMQIKRVLKIASGLGKLPPDVVTSDEFMDMFKAGDLDEGDLLTLSKYPSAWDEAVEAWNTKQFLAGDPSDDEIFSYMFGDETQHVLRTLTMSPKSLTPQGRKARAEVAKLIGPSGMDQLLTADKEERDVNALFADLLESRIGAGSNPENALNPKNKGKYTTQAERTQSFFNALKTDGYVKPKTKKKAAPKVDYAKKALETTEKVEAVNKVIVTLDDEIGALRKQITRAGASTTGMWKTNELSTKLRELEEERKTKATELKTYEDEIASYKKHLG